MHSPSQNRFGSPTGSPRRADGGSPSAFSKSGASNSINVTKQKQEQQSMRQSAATAPAPATRADIIAAASVAPRVSSPPIRHASSSPALGGAKRGPTVPVPFKIKDETAAALPLHPPRDKFVAPNDHRIATTFGKEDRDMREIPVGGRGYALSPSELVLSRVAFQGGIGQPQLKFRNTCGSVGTDTVVNDENFYGVSTLGAARHHKLVTQQQQQQQQSPHRRLNTAPTASSSTGGGGGGFGATRSLRGESNSHHDASMLNNTTNNTNVSNGNTITGHAHSVKRFATHHNDGSSGRGGGRSHTPANNGGGGTSTATDSYMDANPRAAEVPSDLIDYEKLLRPDRWERRTRRQLHHQRALLASERQRLKGSCRSAALFVGTNNHNSSSYGGANNGSGFGGGNGSTLAPLGDMSLGAFSLNNNSSLYSSAVSGIITGSGGNVNSPTAVVGGLGGSSVTMAMLENFAAGNAPKLFGTVRDPAAAIEAAECRTTRPKHYEKVYFGTGGAVHGAGRSAGPDAPPVAGAMKAALSSTLSGGGFGGPASAGAAGMGGGGILRRSASSGGVGLSTSPLTKSALSRHNNNGSGAGTPTPGGLPPAGPANHQQRAASAGHTTSRGSSARQRRDDQRLQQLRFRNERVSSGRRLVGPNGRNDLARSALTGLLTSTFQGRGYGSGLGEGCSGSLAPAVGGEASRATSDDDDDDDGIGGRPLRTVYDLSGTSGFAKASAKAERQLLQCGDRRPVAAITASGLRGVETAEGAAAIRSRRVAALEASKRLTTAASNANNSIGAASVNFGGGSTTFGSASFAQHSSYNMNASMNNNNAGSRLAEYAPWDGVLIAPPLAGATAPTSAVAASNPSYPQNYFADAPRPPRPPTGGSAAGGGGGCGGGLLPSQAGGGAGALLQTARPLSSGGHSDEDADALYCGSDRPHTPRERRKAAAEAAARRLPPQHCGTTFGTATHNAQLKEQHKRRDRVVNATPDRSF